MARPAKSPADDVPATLDLTLRVRVVPLAEGFVALANMGGVPIRSSLTDTKVGAVLNLFAKVVNNLDDCQTGVALWAQGTTIAAELDGLSELGAGS